MTTATAAAGVIEHIDPQTLDVSTNVRREAHASLDKEFIDSIRANGVIVPIVATRDDQGVHVRYGQRRTLAAQQVGTPTVPVYVVDVDEADTAQRIVEQLVENDQRQALSDSDRVQAWKALELEGLSVAAIAKRTGTRRETIKTGMTVAASDVAATAIQAHALTLDQAAALLDFEGDDATVTRLIETATTDPAQFAHAAQRARDDKARQELRASTEQELTDRGFVVLGQRPGYWDKTPVSIENLIDARTGEAVTGDQIAGLAGSAAYVQVYNTGSTDVTYYLDDPKAHGFKKRPANGAKVGGMTDEEKAERRLVIENNRAWDAAETVRREWVAAFLSRKTLPKDATQVIAQGLTSARFHVSAAMSKGNSLAADLLGIEPSSGWYADQFAEYLTAHPTRAGHVALAVVLGGIESSTGRNTWRNPGSDAGRYLQTLAGWGYSLSPVEKIAAGIGPDEN